MTTLKSPAFMRVLRSVDLWIKGSVKSRAFLLRRDASSTLPSGVSHELFYPEISPPQYIGGPATFMNEE